MYLKTKTFPTENPLTSKLNELNPTSALNPVAKPVKPTNPINTLNKTHTYDMTPTIETTNIEDGGRLFAQITPHVLKKTGNQGKKGNSNNILRRQERYGSKIGYWYTGVDPVTPPPYGIRDKLMRHGLFEASIGP